MEVFMLVAIVFYLVFYVAAVILHTRNFRSIRDVVSSLVASIFWPITVAISILRKL